MENQIRPYELPKCIVDGHQRYEQVTSPIYRTRSIIVLDLVKKTHRCNAQQAGKRRFLILEFLLFFGEATLLPLSFTLFCATLSSFLAVSYHAMVHETEHWLQV